MTDALFLAFQSASGDNHPVHDDIEYCRRRGMPHMLAHGYQVLIQTAAALIISRSWSWTASLASLTQSSRFLLPAYAGDTLYPALEIAELAPNRTTDVIGIKSTVHNQIVQACDGRRAALPREAQAFDLDASLLRPLSGDQSFHFGARFSTKARRPSCAASVTATLTKSSTALAMLRR